LPGRIRPSGLRRAAKVGTEHITTQSAPSLCTGITCLKHPHYGRRFLLNEAASEFGKQLDVRVFAVHRLIRRILLVAFGAIRFASSVAAATAKGIDSSLSAPAPNGK
jgi:hypothetical protein